MSRPIILSNGELHVGINKFGLVHDFYFPYVGLENHAAGKQLRHRIGVWIQGSISWLDDGSWTFDFNYPMDSLIGHTIAKNENLNLILEFDDAVDSTINAFMRNIHIINLSNSPREIRLFMHQAFVIGDSRSNTDTAQYLPDSDAILHYRGRRVFIVSGCRDNGNEVFDQYTVGLFDIEGHEGTYRDADDGELSSCNVEHGRVDSTLRFAMNIKGLSSERVHYWITAGTSNREALQIHKEVKNIGIDKLLHTTANWWKKWLEPAIKVADKVPANHRDYFIKSVMIIKSQIDNRGAVIASTDSTMLKYWRDAYAYCWPRDGAYVLWPLIRMGYVDEPLRFFEFCRQALHPSGYLSHKYSADGAIGSSWHPYVHNNNVLAPPIQEDETALTLFVFAQFYNMHPGKQLLDDYYDSLVRPMADFMASYINDTTGLPKASYDLWEQTFLTTTYTTSVVYAALSAAADLADSYNDEKNAVKWRSSADDISTAAHKYLYNENAKHFHKGLSVNGDLVTYNETFDMSSVFGGFMFGLFSVQSPQMKEAINTLEQKYSKDGVVLGLPRFDNDDYLRVDSNVTGNYWPITSLWLSQYYIEMGHIDKAMAILDWVKSHSLATGVLSEQINPINGSMVSVAPLTWSHAEYVATLIDSTTGVSD